MGLTRAAGRPTEVEVAEVAGELGVAAEGGGMDVLLALARVRSGGDLEEAARGLEWAEFEEFCALVLSASGYSVERNVQLRRPRRQLDIVAESASMVLSVDCKHWRRGTGSAGLERLALAQAERTRQYKTRLDAPNKRTLPMLLTMVDNVVRVAAGVPVVPVFAVRDFLSGLSPFDEGFLFV